VLGFEAADPAGYGRLVLRDGALVAIREEKDASEAERAIAFCNSGLMAFDGGKALAILDRIDQANAKREFYLTQAVEIARGQGLDVAALRAPEDELIGVNDRVQLAAVEAVVQRGLRDCAMRDGATLVAPETVMLAWDTRLGRDVLVEPNVVFGPGVVVEDEATVRAFSHVEGARVARGAQVGPFARLRPGTAIEAKARIGNFVEVKAAVVRAGAKVNHLAYVGDAEIGAGANIGAGTITCNYDGFRKSRTTVGAGAFIGSNVALVAPVTVGAGAIVGAGSTITKSVEPDALAVARGRQESIAGWAARLRARRAKV
jgi:bifunctional UDP-N-acetylglucosamine pyrophosphorylase/glucosamine-1-phosphate N-acetyltransferase